MTKSDRSLEAAAVRLAPNADYLRVCALGHMRGVEPRSAGSCDVRSHVVSEYVEGGWLMPGT